MASRKQAFKSIVNELMPVIEKSKTVDLIEVNDEEMFIDVDVARYYNRRKNSYEELDTTILTRHEYETSRKASPTLSLSSWTSQKTD